WFLSRVHLLSSFLSFSARSLNFSKEDLEDLVRLGLCHFTPLLYMAPKLNSWVEVILYVFFQLRYKKAVSWLNTSLFVIGWQI
ncbi:unnamed protein product, partial [Gulo gulo]